MNRVQAEMRGWRAGKGGGGEVLLLCLSPSTAKQLSSLLLFFFFKKRKQRRCTEKARRDTAGLRFSLPWHPEHAALRKRKGCCLLSQCNLFWSCITGWGELGERWERGLDSARCIAGPEGAAIPSTLWSGVGGC